MPNSAHPSREASSVDLGGSEPALPAPPSSGSDTNAARVDAPHHRVPRRDASLLHQKENTFDGVKIAPTSHGRGLLATRAFPNGEDIGRVTGEILLGTGYGSDYCIEFGEEASLEPGPPFCYLNHSCEPNCELVHYFSEEEASGEESQGTGSGPEDLGEIWVQAIRPIHPEEELTIDYQWPAEQAIRCGCGSPQCRGWIVCPDQLDQLMELDSEEG